MPQRIAYKGKKYKINETTEKNLDDLIEAVSKENKKKLKEDYAVRYIKNPSNGDYEIIQHIKTDFGSLEVFKQLYTITATFEDKGLGAVLKQLCDENIDYNQIKDKKIRQEIKDLKTKSLHVRKSLVEVIHVLAGLAEIVHFFI